MDKKRNYTNALRKVLEMADGRELVLFGTDELSVYVYDNLVEMGQDIKYFVSDEENGFTDIKGRKIKRSIELLYEDKTDIFIAAFVFKNHGMIYQTLIDLGYGFEKDFILYGFGGYSAKFDAVDSLLGYNRFYGDSLGFYIHDDRRCGHPYKIICLGGSTTDPTYGNNKPWTSFLYDKFVSLGKNVVIYNGGLGGYCANQEFLKLMRDGLDLKPDMVITFDGFNDVACSCTDREYPWLHVYQRKVYDYIERKGDFAPDTLDMRKADQIVHGAPKTDKKDYERWTESIRNIHAVCEEYGIYYAGFLQPLIQNSKAVLSETDTKLIEKACEAVSGYRRTINGMKAFYDHVYEFVKEKDYMHDLMNIFDGKAGMFSDHCHNTEKANEVIADEIFYVIKDQIR